MKKINFLIPLLIILFAYPSLTVGQSNENAFNFNDDPQKYNIEKPDVEVDYSEIEMIEDHVKGELILVSKNRWKSWVERSIYVLLVNTLILILIVSMPKNNESAIIVSYLLSGAGAVMSLWLFLCAVLLFRLNAGYSAIIFLPVSFILAAINYFLLLRTKKSDISLSELKESFQKLEKASPEDPRLISITGIPGDWPDDDFIK